MMKVVSAVWRMPWSTLIGLSLGIMLVLMAPHWAAPILDLYDDAYPVVSPVSTTVVDRGEDNVRVHIVIEKHRGDECRLLRMYGYAVDASGVRGMASVARPDAAQSQGIVHDAGIIDTGIWVVKPVTDGATSVLVYTEHACLGRVIRSRMAEVQFEGRKS